MGETVPLSRKLPSYREGERGSSVHLFSCQDDQTSSLQNPPAPLGSVTASIAGFPLFLYFALPGTPVFPRQEAAPPAAPLARCSRVRTQSRKFAQCFALPFEVDFTSHTPHADKRGGHSIIRALDVARKSGGFYHHAKRSNCGTFQQNWRPKIFSKILWKTLDKRT